jgi:putative endonuclease
MDYYVYLLASHRHGTLYAGVTNDLVRRVYQHREGLLEGFTKKYGVKTLVWFDSTGSVEGAIRTEKRLKNWKREWKIALIEKGNPEWRDLYPDLV